MAGNFQNMPGVQNIQLADAPAKYGSVGLRVYGKTPDAAISPRICWTTYDSAQDSFDISVRWRGVPKGGDGGDEYGYTPWSSWVTNSFSKAECNLWNNDTDDMCHWWVSLDDATNAAQIGGSWTYNTRVYDHIDIGVQIGAHPTGVADVYSNVGTLYVGAYPDYSVTDMYVQGDWLVIQYEAPGWTRKDDRWAIVEFTKDNREVLRPGSWGSQAGKVEKLGWVTIPRSALQTLLEEGDTVRLHIRWNAWYMASGADWRDWDGVVTLSGHGSANTPTGGVTVNPDGSISVDVGDSGSGGGSINSWQVTIEGGGLEFDEISVTELDPNALLRYPPLDVPVTVQVQGSTVTGGASSIVSQTVTVPSDGRLLIDPIDSTGERTSEQIVAKLNLDWSASSSRDKTVMKFAGRSRPSVAFGVGGSGTVSVSWVEPNPGRLPVADRFQSLSQAGMCVVRCPGGERYLVAIDSVDTSEACDKGYTDVSISGQEVV